MQKGTELTAYATYAHCVQADAQAISVRSVWGLRPHPCQGFTQLAKRCWSSTVSS